MSLLILDGDDETAGSTPTLAGTATTAGVLTGTVEVSGVFAGTATTAGSLVSGTTVNGTLAGTATTAGALAGAVVRNGVLAGTATTSGALAGTVQTVVSILPIIHGPMVNGPFGIVQPDVFVPELSVTLHTRNNPTGLVTELENSFARQFRDDLNDAGSAQLTLDSEDSDVSLVTEEMIVRFNLRGVPVFDAFLEQIAMATLVNGEEHDQVRAYQGRGKIAIMEEGLVYPSYPPGSVPVEDDRTFDWTSPQFDDSAWDQAKEICTVGFAQTNWATQPFAQDWTNLSDFVIWTNDGTVTVAYPDITNFFRINFTVAATGRYKIESIADDVFTLWIDGVHPSLVAADGRTAFETTKVDYFNMTAGPHLIAVQASNYDYGDPANASNPAGLAVDIAPVDIHNVVTGASILSTSSAWKVLTRSPDGHFPGMTIGHIIRLVVEEAQTRGCIPEITLGFNDLTDSNGNPWLDTPLVSTKVGTDLLTFLRELSGTYCDFWMPPGSFTLYACKKGFRGVYKTAVTLGAPTDPDDPRSGNVTNLTHKRTV